jgi:uncharacterized protein (DUF2236 family)
MHLAPTAFFTPASGARKLLIQNVRKVFHVRGEKPVAPSDNALFPRGSVIRRVHGDVTAMMIGGIAALLLQMLHPAALAGIWDHSAFREDMIGRLRRTARFIAVTTFADQGEALASIARVKAIHARVRGTMPDGAAYSASDPELLAWVHACEAWCFLEAWRRYGDPAMSLQDKNAYISQSGRVAALLGADPVPETRAQLVALIGATKPRLRADQRTEEARRIVVDPPGLSLSARSVHRLLTNAAIGLLPEWARGMHGFPYRALNEFEAAAGAKALAIALRWAFESR